jgi:hypothetical protein
MTQVRIVIADDGRKISVITYAGAAAVARVNFDGIAALVLGNRLVDAGLRHLTRPTEQSSARRRGGDPRPDLRHERDSAIRDLACAIGADLSLEQQADAVISRATRYRPMPGDAEGTGERRALHRIHASGLPVPKQRQARRILSLAKQRTCLDGQTVVPPSQS